MFSVLTVEKKGGVLPDLQADRGIKLAHLHPLISGVRESNLVTILHGSRFTWFGFVFADKTRGYVKVVNNHDYVCHK